MRTAHRSPVLSVFVLLLAAPLLPSDAADTAVRLEKAMKSLTTLRADFEQLYFAASIAEPIRETGELFLRKPDFMRWEYKKPEKKVFLTGNGRFQMFLPGEKQLTRSAIPKEAYEQDIIGILTGSRSLLDAYAVETISFPTSHFDVRQIKLTPKVEGDFSHILVEVDTGTWLLRRVIIIEWAGNKREYNFDRMKPNAVLPKDAFELKVPSDCEVIEDR